MNALQACHFLVSVVLKSFIFTFLQIFDVMICEKSMFCLGYCKSLLSLDLCNVLLC